MSKSERLAVTVFFTIAVMALIALLFILFGWVWIDTLPNGESELVICTARQVMDLCIYIGTGFKG